MRIPDIYVGDANGSVVLCLIRMEPVLTEPVKSQHNQFPYGNEIQIPSFCVFELGLEFWHEISIWVWDS